MKVLIRPAFPDDKPRVLEMVDRFCANTIYGELLAGATGAARVFDLCLQHGAIYVATVAGNEPNTVATVGFIAGVAARSPISELLIAEEVAWWVEPEWRNSTLGPKLLGAFEHWARQTGAHVLKMVAPAEFPAVGRYYKRIGMREAEANYFKRL